MQNSNCKIKLLLICLIILSAQISFAASGRRKHFLSHGPSVAAFGAGETVFAAYKDPAVIQYNPSLMAFFSENSISLSRFNLYEGSANNSGSAAFGLGKNYFFGISASNLSSGDIELRDDVYSSVTKASANTWDFILSGAGFFKPLGIAYGVNIKYLYYDLYVNTGGTYMADAGLAKFMLGPEMFGSNLKIKLGLSAQNFAAGEIKVDKDADEIPGIYRLSTAFILPTYYRFKTQDTLSVFADLKYEDDFMDFYGGLSYTLADKYVARLGYYTEHFTFGFGVDFYSFTIDYAADFSEVDMINRFGLSYRWGLRKNDELAKEAKAALDKEKISLQEAEKRFNGARKLYNKGEYLRATDMLSDIVVSYPNFESPLHFYTKIINDMNKTANSNDELDFDKLTYARAYCAYYKTDYKEALSEWNKFNYFTGGTDEVAEYMNRINDAIKQEQMNKREKELDGKASALLAAGVKDFNSSRWVECIKAMEKLQKFVSENNFSKTIEYYSKAKDYIDKSVIELSKSIKSERKEKAKEPQSEAPKEEKQEIDEEGADKKYNEGLILYAQGRYLEAERIWELTLRLNPKHQKAKTALSKLRNSGYLAE